MKIKSLHLLFLFVCTLFYGCGQRKEEKNFVIGFSQCTGGDAWRQAMHEEMKREVSFYPDLSLEIKDAENNSEQQIAHIRQFIEQGVDILVVSPNESEPITPIVEEAYKKGIPVILVDRKTNSPLYTAFVGGNNYEIGKLAGYQIARLLEGKGRVAEVWGAKGSSPAKERHRGFREVIESFQGIQVVAEINGEWEKDIAKKNFYDFVKGAEEEVDLVYAHNDPMALGVYEILGTINNKKKVKIIGVDGLGGPGGGMELVEKGILDATFLYPTGGEEVIQLANKILHKEPFQANNLLSSTMIDERNVHIMSQQANRIISQQHNIERQQGKLEEQLKVYRSQQTLIYAMLGSLVLVLLLGVGIFIALRKKQAMNRELKNKQEEILMQQEELQTQADTLLQTNDNLRAIQEEIELQRDHLKIANEQVMSSIQYAKTIQNAILPSSLKIAQIFPQHFILYRPKDVVSGDFYWFSHLSKEESGLATDLSFMAVVDCTGHGVPGAFMSIIGSTILNEIVNQKQVTDPADILELLDEGVKGAVEKAEGMNTAGMDVCLCQFERGEGDQVKVLFSGAKRNLMLVRKGKEIIENVTADRRSIGSPSTKPFTTQELILESGSMLYLTSDGYADQNNPLREKLGIGKLNETVMKSFNLPVLQQRNIFEQALDQHQQDSEQRDDITVVGIRV